MNFLFLAIFWILYFTAHSTLTSNRLKRGIKTKHPNFYPYYRITYNIIALLTLVPVLYYQNSLSNQDVYQRHMATEIIGYTSLLIGLIIGYLALKNYSGAEFSGLDYNKKPEDKINILNTSGLNNIVRHPLYFSALLIIWGYFIAVPDLKILIMNSVITTYFIVGTKLEEQKLIKEFGQQYIDYKKKVPMLLPFGFIKHQR